MLLLLRAAGMNSQVRRVCNARTSLVRLFGFLDDAIEQQSDRSALRNAQLHMPTMFLPRTALVWFGDELLKPLKFGLGVWPMNFMLEEIDAASLFCGGSGNHLVDGPDRAEALGKLEYLGDMVVDVETVACIVENRGGTDMRYLVFAMKGGSHLCSCRTLQTLGLCCRHFWMAMCLNRAFRFHVGILHKHWLSEQGCKPMDDWPIASRPRWSVALKHKRSDAEGGGVVAGDPTPPSEGRWKAIAEGGTIQSTLMQMKENGPTVQDRRKLYVDLLKESTAMIAQGVDTVDAETLRQIFAACKTQISQAGRIGLGAGVVVGNPETVRLPAGRRLGNKRHKSSVETRYSATGTRTASQSYN